jgi:hypothetical protein
LAGIEVNQPGAWVGYLKIHPEITATAGSVLSPDELRDIEQARAKLIAQRDQARRALYERFPYRYLGGHKTVEGCDAHHPGPSILRWDSHSPYHRCDKQ